PELGPGCVASSPGHADVRWRVGYGFRCSRPAMPDHGIGRGGADPADSPPECAGSSVGWPPDGPAIAPSVRAAHAWRLATRSRRGRLWRADATDWHWPTD